MIGNARAGPHQRNGLASVFRCGAQVQLQRQFHPATIHLAGDTDRVIATVGETPLDADGVACKEVWQNCRRDFLGCQCAPVDLDIGQHGHIKPGSELHCLFLAVEGGINDAGDAAAKPGHLSNQIPIHSGPHPKGIEPALANRSCHQLQNFCFIAHIAVRQEHNDAQNVGIGRLGIGPAQAAQDLRSTACGDGVHVGGSCCNVLRGGRQRRRAEFARIV